MLQLFVIPYQGLVITGGVTPIFGLYRTNRETACGSRHRRPEVGFFEQPELGDLFGNLSRTRDLMFFIPSKEAQD